MLCARGGQLVDPNPAVCGRDTPLSLHELLFEKALQRWVQRAFFDLKQILRSSFDVLYQRIAVQRLAFQHSENHHLQCPGEQITLCCFFHGRGFFPASADLLAQCLEQNSIGLPGSRQIKLREGTVGFDAGGSRIRRWLSFMDSGTANAVRLTPVIAGWRLTALDSGTRTYLHPHRESFVCRWPRYSREIPALSSAASWAKAGWEWCMKLMIGTATSPSRSKPSLT